MGVEIVAATGAGHHLDTVSFPVRLLFQFLDWQPGHFCGIATCGNQTCSHLRQVNRVAEIVCFWLVVLMALVVPLVVVGCQTPILEPT